MLEATQNAPKHVSTIIRDAGTGLGAALTPSLLALLVIQIKKGGLTSYSTITPVLTAVGTSGLLDLALSSGNLDTLGVLHLFITGPGVLPNDELFIDVIAVDKTDAVRGGMTSLPNAAAAAAGGLPTIGATIPNATAGTASGIALKQNVDDAATSVNAHTDTATAGVTSGVNTHTDTATAGVTSAVNNHTDSAVTASTATLAADITASTTAVLAAIPSATTIRDAVLNAARSGHLTTGSIGEGVALATSLLQGNYYIDNVDNSSPNGPLSQRLRCFVSAAAMAGATYGGTGQGEFATFAVTTTYDGVNKIHDHKVVQQ